MDSAITEGYENTGNVADINKQISYSGNTMDFTQDTYSTNAPTDSGGFQVTQDPYQVQQSSDSLYNPVESVQHLQYEHQGQHDLQNISSQNYYAPQETQYQGSYIPEQTQDSDTVHRNNGIGDIHTEEFVDNTQNSIAEHFDNNEGVASTTSNSNFVEQSIQPTATESEPEAIKMEYADTPRQEPISDNQNGQESLDNFQEDQMENNQEKVTPAGNDTVKEETIVREEVSNIDETNLGETNVEESTVEEPNVENMVVEQVVEEASTIESGVDSTEFTDLQTFESEQDTYSIVEEISEEATTSQKDDSQAPVVEDELTEVRTEECGQNNSEDVETIEKKPRKTRKPIFEVPMHLLGHDINKPVDPVQNGSRALPKPRLGVKVPYRNLTSQIVSKAELEEVILERSRAKEQASNKANIKFARSLTQRLANKIVPDKGPKDKKSNKEISDNGGKEKEDIIEIDDTGKALSQEPSNSAAIDDSKIQNDDDLLAILEGEGEEIPLLNKEVSDSQADDSNIKLLEREIALQQLQELPLQEAKERILKPRYSNRTPTSLKSETPPKSRFDKNNTSNSTVSTPKSTKSTPQSTKSTPHKVSSQSLPKPNSSSPKKSSEIDLDIPSPVKKQIEVEPQVKVNMVLKTYSRKRKPSDMMDFEASSPKRPSFDDPDLRIDTNPKSDPLAIPTDVYVTKSSRVIKKKVIWDPDDDQTPKTSKTTVSKAVESPKNVVAKVVKVIPGVEKKVIEKTVDKPKPEQKTAVKSPEKSIEKVIPRKVISKKSPVSKPKKGLSEVDRLLMDEGAVKMLYDLKGDANASKKKKDIYSVEKAEKDIMKKANLLKNDLVQNTSNESPKSLRKKEGPVLISPISKPTPILERKMSKDSTRSSVHTPPRSPNMFSSQSSMLIRRRSSSSISSDDMDQSFTSKMTKSSKTKKQKKNASNTGDNKDSKEKLNSPAKDVAAKPVKGAQYKSFTMKRSGKHVSIDLNYIDDKCYFTIQVLEELLSALKKLEKDKECNVVSLTSTSTSFCLGLDYTYLVSGQNTERIDKATELAETLREFLLCLLHFPKILVAGIQGKCVGLGVTMLPLFDTVIASDTATFSTPYATLGCLGEAICLFAYPNLSNNGLAAELLYANQTLKADEACRRGLISKLCWPEKYKETLKNVLSSIAQGSRQSLETTKRQLRANLTEEIEAAIDTEMDILIEHWSSSECQENFSKIKK